MARKPYTAAVAIGVTADDDVTADDEADLIDAPRLPPIGQYERWLRPLSAFGRRVTEAGAGRRYG